VLGAAEADPLGAELAGALGVLGGVGVGADAEGAGLVLGARVPIISIDINMAAGAVDKKSF